MDTMACRLSRYVHSHEVTPGVIGAYSPFGHQVTFMDTNIWADLKAGFLPLVPAYMLDDLVKRGFLVKDDFERNVLNTYPPPPTTIQELWLIITKACNMACSYCVVKGNIRHHAEQCDNASNAVATAMLMDRNVLDSAVQMFFKHLRHDNATPRVVLYGGEPLLNKSLIGYAVMRIRETEKRSFPRQRPIQILVITNGSVYDSALTNLFKEYRVSVSVSIDGMKHHHDSARRTPEGEETFDRVCQSLRNYMDAGLNTGICTTIGTHNVDDLPDIAEFFSATFGIPVQFQVPYEVPLANGNPSYVPMRDAAAATLEAFDRFRSRGIVEGLTMRRFSLFSQGAFHHFDCQAVGGQIVVSPEGKIGPCHSLVGDPRHFIGDVRDADCTPFGQSIFEQWWRRMPINMQECQDCPAIALCGGGCPYNALMDTGSIWRKDPQQCEYMKILIDWLLQDSWKNKRARNYAIKH